jgi:hypothetical protein
MELKLFKEPYIDSGSPQRLRLLFECVLVGGADVSSCDFYLYTWIEDYKYCTGFQIIADDEFVIEWHAPHELVFGRIGGKPLGRSIQDVGRGVLHDRMIETMHSAHSDYFSDLIRQIGVRLLDRKTSFLDLTIEEKEILRGLVNKIWPGKALD